MVSSQDEKKQQQKTKDFGLIQLCVGCVTLIPDKQLLSYQTVYGGCVDSGSRLRCAGKACGDGVATRYVDSFIYVLIITTSSRNNIGINVRVRFAIKVKKKVQEKKKKRRRKQKQKTKD